MDMEIYFPQLEEILDRDAAIKDLLKMMADRMNTLESAIAAITATPTPRPPVQTQQELPFDEASPAPKKPAKGKGSKVKTLNAQHAPAATDGADGAEDNSGDLEDEEDLRGRASFEARRTTRLFGIAGTRATIKQVAGANILTVDDVPVAKLPTLIKALQAL